MTRPVKLLWDANNRNSVDAQDLSQEEIAVPCALGTPWEEVRLACVRAAHVDDKYAPRVILSSPSTGHVVPQDEVAVSHVDTTPLVAVEFFFFTLAVSLSISGLVFFF